MSMRSELRHIAGARHAKCHHEMLRDRQTDDVLRDRVARIAEKFEAQEAKLSVEFTRTYLKDIERMLNRERDLRRIIKEITGE